MSSTDAQDVPIYAGLVKERGDVLADFRDMVEKVQPILERPLDFSGLRAPAGIADRQTLSTRTTGTHTG